MAIRERVPMVSALIAGLGIATVLLLPASLRGPAGNGAAFLFAAYAEALAVVGLGFALALAPLRPALSGILLFAAGVFAGWAVKDRALSLLAERPVAFEYTGFIGPLACVLSGVALAVSGSRRRFLAPAAALPVGIAVGFVMALKDPSLGESQFLAGAAAAAFWLLLVPLALLPYLDTGYVATGGRILASWLVALGLMLGATKAVGPHEVSAVAGRMAEPPAVHFSVPVKPPSEQPQPGLTRRPGEGN